MNLADDDVPEKTDRGAAEIRTRALGALKLPARLRTVLLLVDGVRPLRELKAMLSSEQDLIPALASLHELGLLRVRAPVRKRVGAPDKSAGRTHTVARPTARPVEDEPACVAGQMRAQVLTEAHLDGAGSMGEPPATVGHNGFRRARAHLANALDEGLGVHGYLRRQQVASCATFGELASLLDAIRADLLPAMGIQATADLIDQVHELSAQSVDELKLADATGHAPDYTCPPGSDFL